MITPSIRSLLRDFGKLLHLPLGLAILTLPVIIYFKEWFALWPFTWMSALSLLGGQLLYQSFKGAEKTEKGFSIIFVASAWLLLPLLGTIPFMGIARMASGEEFEQLVRFSTFKNSFFESMSGFTGTGLTMLDDPTEIPRTLQWWRSFSEWIGGIGVVMLASLLLKLNHDDEKLYMAETRNWTVGEDTPIAVTIHKIWIIYAGYTSASVLAFYLGGMPFWEALNHGMTAFGTGGFSVTENSFTNYSTTIKAITVFVMLLGAIAFKIHYLVLFRFQFKSLLRQTQLVFFLFFLLISFFLLHFVIPAVPAIDQIFQVASALATCGLNTVDLSTWPADPLFILIILMILGANGGSTGGGIKTIRFAWFVKGIWRSVKQTWKVKGEATITFNEEPVENKRVTNHIQQAANILFLYFITLSIGTFALAIIVGDQFDFNQILFDTSSALSNVGLSSGVTNIEMPATGKYLLCLLMWLGRLEILAVVILFISPFIQRNVKSS